MATTKVKFRCVVSYPSVFTAKSVNGGDPKFGLCAIVKKDDIKSLSAIKAGIEELKKQNPDFFTGKPAKLPLRDGDVERPDQEEFKNSFFLSCNSNRRPIIQDQMGNLIEVEDDFYPGCIAGIVCNLYTTSTGGKKVCIGLNGAKKLAEGERLGGFFNADEEFKDFENDIEQKQAPKQDEFIF